MKCFHVLAIEKVCLILLHLVNNSLEYFHRFLGATIKISFKKILVLNKVTNRRVFIFLEIT